MHKKHTDTTHAGAAHDAWVHPRPPHTAAYGRAHLHMHMPHQADVRHAFASSRVW